MTRRVLGVVSVAKLRAMGLERIPLRSEARWAVYYTAEAMARLARGEQVDPTADTAIVRGVLPELAEQRFMVRQPGHPADGLLVQLGGWLDPERGIVTGLEPGADRSGG